MVQVTPPQSFASGTPVVDGDRLRPDERDLALRIYYVPLSMISAPDQWPAILDACVGMGFNTLMLSAPSHPGPAGNLLLPFDLGRPHPALPPEGSLEASIGELAGACRQRNLDLMVDLVTDRVAADSPLAHEVDLRSTGIGARDPRVRPEDRSSADVPFSDPGRSGSFVERYANYLAALARAGIAGFRCLRPNRVPAEVWTRWKASAPTCRFMAWTPGLVPEAVVGLVSAGFEGAFSSIRWWDCRAGWPAEDYERLRQLGPVIAFPEAPFDARLAQTLDSEEIVQRRSERALWIAAALSDGMMIPMGFEFGAREPVPVAGPMRETYAALRDRPRLDLAGAIRSVNAFASRESSRGSQKEMRLLTGGGAPLTALLRTAAGDANRARLVLVNPSLDRSSTLAAAALSPEVGRFLPFNDILGSGPTLSPESTLLLRPAEVRVLEGRANRPIMLPREASRMTEKTAVAAPRLAIEAVSPTVDGGRYPVKRIVGEVLRVEADAFAEGHDQIAVALKWRAADETDWQERRMRPLGNDRYTADMPLTRLGRYVFCVEAWRDEFAIFLYELTKKHEAGLKVTLELEEGRRLVEHSAGQSGSEAAARLKPVLNRLAHANDAERLDLLIAPETAALMAEADPRPFRLTSDPMPVDAERTAAGFASWYELFPRSQSGDPHRHGTFDDVIGRLPAIRAMGFDVAYFPPIHPIGRTNRKGRNNSLTAGPDDPGSPYAIGAEAGGHDAIHPELGSFEDFRRLVAAAAEQGLEIALDLAIQASPDHPWLEQHPDWFNWRPDGSIRYAENPPKKYEDIVNVDFYAEGAKPSLWTELRNTIMVWVEQGVKLFRVDNPHTKPFPFWEWVIEDVRRDHPDVIFLSEAFTRPKVMYRLAKIGFSQSYTYFTWRNTKAELTEYLTELTTQPPKDFFRPHFFVNTHDINPDFLQNAPRPAFLIRAALATTLSGLWGMYNGFELCEGRPDAKKKEYADSEKYQLYAWDWDRPGNIISEISRLNRIRRDNPALHSHLGITFRAAYNDNTLLFQKSSPARDNVLLIAVSLDPFAAQEADIEVPLWDFDLPDNGTIVVDDLMRGHRFTWTGKYQRIRLDPAELPFSIWRLGAARNV
ncbi:alpha-1,4-glucan--maltose-1-phosphate maltosyltransferase [Lichenifustis flavocetrariae]|uniref:Alpha-1,4-glucan:maltose-1-phosphate maltosyltransferase n=1 Tax=Lichenifustis flavocetrariae TaxID=2949735 RepID=A0AA42CKS8_9HYPH|nr:alpha-1,4-glucan--maltose-1-phosphate maltosyltransferase [Lichenifustis flavocetrariae]MCW6506605.1 alpha-1,4-glucan--maltose-1-phosphate maltosyltransferase [Lichenifustis flavocetrariae]